MRQTTLKPAYLNGCNQDRHRHETLIHPAFHAGFAIEALEKKIRAKPHLFHIYLPSPSVPYSIDGHSNSDSVTVMVSGKEKLLCRVWRWAKILFFVANMLVSLLAFAPPLLVVLLDLLLPSVLHTAAAGSSVFSTPALAAQLRSYRFGSSLVDLPVLSAARSLILLCFYLYWSGGAPYLGVATICATASAGYVSLKAVAMFGVEALPGKRHLLSFREKEVPAVEVLFLSSLALAMAHVIAAYRTNCRERRKLLVYKIDIEAVSAYNSDYSNYHKDCTKLEAWWNYGDANI